jgi:hypothetical protein
MRAIQERENEATTKKSMELTRGALAALSGSESHALSG